MLTPALLRSYRMRLLAADHPGRELGAVLAELRVAYRRRESRRSCLLELAASVDTHRRFLETLDPAPAAALRAVVRYLRAADLPRRLERL